MHWPELPYEDWKDTLYGLHRWTQIVGKIRLANTPLLNHGWNSTLYVTPRGLTTGLVPSADQSFQIDLDLVEHQVRIVTSHRGERAIPLRAMPVATFYWSVMGALETLDIDDAQITTTPNEVDVAIPFPKDVAARPYDRDAVRRFAAALLSTTVVFERHRATFFGKASPVHFFWGSFDLAHARFSGRRAPPYAGGVPPHIHPHVMHEAYSHQLISVGFWPGNDGAPHAEYYAYAMPAIPDLPKARIEPAAAAWDDARGEFLLPYDAVRTSSDPAATLLSFLRSTYAAAADLAQWDRTLLEDPVECLCDVVPPTMRRPMRRAS